MISLPSPQGPAPNHQGPIFDLLEQQYQAELARVEEEYQTALRAVRAKESRRRAAYLGSDRVMRVGRQSAWDLARLERGVALLVVGVRES